MLSRVKWMDLRFVAAYSSLSQSFPYRLIDYSLGGFPWEVSFCGRLIISFSIAECS